MNNKSIRLNKTGIIDLVFHPVRCWVDQIKVTDVERAKCVLSFIPLACPFARTVRLFGHKILEIPPLCEFNPTY